ncbi:hypothetical protein BFP97_18165 [Roseivirga sp. 4D4]|uniref:hypothetical protein n=1 Tax=Roseivirga sp. 4D4 TaxID=1889784 RepID=UPI000852A106|nr:hypothetical protein [Roseivirga sp. 4D4]OEK03331.1 hypothetical protein BFP97_18165 [Roseivirga sp. 4D4]
MKKLFFILTGIFCISIFTQAQTTHNTGLTTLTNPAAGGRTLEIRKDNDDGFITFHDPGEYWYSMGLQRSTGYFKINHGGDINTTKHFLMNTLGDIGFGTFPGARLDILGKTFTLPLTEKVAALRLKNEYKEPGRYFKNSAVDFMLSRWEAGGNHMPETQLDFRLSGNASQTYDNDLPNVDVMTLRSDGNVGIGTTSPKSALHVAGNTPLDWQGSSKGSGLLTLANPSGNGSLFINTPTHNSFYSAGLGIDGSYDNRHSEINIKAFGVKYNSWYSSLVFHTSNGENLNEVMRLDRLGNVGIGTNSPSEKLEVNGTVKTKKVKVEANGWPDYVFSPNYKLKNLSELEAYIQANQHLPEVPSAKEIEEKGQDLGDIQATLLKKVEELTLYLIQENKEKKELKKENQELKELFLELKKEVESLKTQKQ